jgi:penicillin-binding protein 1A
MKIRRLAFIATTSVSLACLGAGVLFLPFDVPELKPVLDYHPYQTVRFLSKEGESFATLNRQRREVVEIGLIPPLIQQAFLVAEDSNFFYHFGLDLRGILRALILNTVQHKWRGRPMGGSTITQQVIKNIILHNKRSMHSKLKEAFYAIQLEKRYPL